MMKKLLLLFALLFSVTIAANAQNKYFTVNGVSFTMIFVKGMTFTMGDKSPLGNSPIYDSSEKPRHKVRIDDYYIGQTEVTQALWVAVMGNNPAKYNVNKLNPVEQVSWEDCQTFIQKLNNLTGEKFRLPTEAEWEFAACGGANYRGCEYSGSNDVDLVAWYDPLDYSREEGDFSAGGTHPVATKAPNELNIYDMSGNVWEWCQDWYDEKYYSSSPTDNPKGPSSGTYHVIRGGSWYQNASFCYVWTRNGDYPNTRFCNLGFRLAL